MLLEIKSRIAPTIIHLVVSTLVVASILLLFKTIYYPGHILKAVGAEKIFAILFFVDITLGPLLTFLIFDKTKKELKRDLYIIVTLQITALGYGVSSLYSARPVYAAFAVDRFELISANKITKLHLKEAQEEYSHLPTGTFKWVYVENPSSYEDRNKILMETLNGGPDLAQRPQFYRNYMEGIDEIIRAAKPISILFELEPSLTDEIKKNLSKYSDFKKYGFIPVSASKSSLSVIINLTTAERITIINVNPWRKPSIEVDNENDIN